MPDSVAPPKRTNRRATRAGLRELLKPDGPVPAQRPRTLPFRSVERYIFVAVAKTARVISVQPRVPAIPASVHRGRVEHVITCMRASLDTPLRLEDMARIAHLSPFHFERVFSSLTGLSAAAFQAASRLDAAKRALLEGNTSITEVCFALGYDSLGSFTTRFTRAVGLSPAAFRARVSQFEGIDMRDVLHAAAARAAVGQSDNPAIRVVLEHARTDDAIAWFGAFPKGIPDRPPSSGTIAIGNATFGLGPLASGIHHVLAASYPPSPSIADYLVQHQQMRVATSGPMRVGDGEPIAILLQLRKLEMTDPPILLALPLFTLRPQAGRSVDASAADTFVPFTSP